MFYSDCHVHVSFWYAPYCWQAVELTGSADVVWCSLGCCFAGGNWGGADDKARDYSGEGRCDKQGTVRVVRKHQPFAGHVWGGSGKKHASSPIPLRSLLAWIQFANQWCVCLCVAPSPSVLCSVFCAA